MSKIQFERGRFCHFILVWIESSRAALSIVADTLRTTSIVGRRTGRVRRWHAQTSKSRLERERFYQFNSVCFESARTARSTYKARGFERGRCPLPMRPGNPARTCRLLLSTAAAAAWRWPI
ncbi:hypothetical protein SCHPADRAFT_748629 [Schizopora paradoxa]|uniref:Uncharacterized protein n=1 Tax=Schizopora paradoxa TaxID=27342 RepID=A0A0H2QYL5_9AGAM|nr:hypothetical protein SCHPADRAFT_748629 [Schizopora paradoxa]